MRYLSFALICISGMVVSSCSVLNEQDENQNYLEFSVFWEENSEHISVVSYYAEDIIFEKYDFKLKDGTIHTPLVNEEKSCSVPECRYPSKSTYNEVDEIDVALVFKGERTEFALKLEELLRLNDIFVHDTLSNTLEWKGLSELEYPVNAIIMSNGSGNKYRVSPGSYSFANRDDKEIENFNLNSGRIENTDQIDWLQFNVELKLADGNLPVTAVFTKRLVTKASLAR